MIYIGIDPGLSGGVGALNQRGQVLLAEGMPTTPSPIANRRMVDGQALSRILRVLVQESGSLTALERVGAMPRQSPVSMFAFGQAYGTVIGVLGSLSMPWDFVQPQKWKSFHSLGPEKAQSLGLVARRWPDLRLRVRDDGIAEALLIADWLRCRNVG